MDDGPDRRAQGDAHRVRDRVADPERHDVECTDVDLVARFERDERVVVELVLLDLVAEEAARQRRRVDRHARELREDVRQRADVVLVRVGDEERLDVGAALLEIGDVGDDEVDAEHLLVGEHEAAIDDDDLVAVLEDVHVLADLAHPAERDDAERMVGRGCGHLGPWVLEEGQLRRGVVGRGRRSESGVAARARVQVPWSAWVRAWTRFPAPEPEPRRPRVGRVRR